MSESEQQIGYRQLQAKLRAAAEELSVPVSLLSRCAIEALLCDLQSGTCWALYTGDRRVALFRFRAHALMWCRPGDRIEALVPEEKPAWPPPNNFQVIWL